MSELHPHEPAAPSATGLSTRTGAILLIYTVVFTALMAIIYQATKAPIEASAQEEKLKLIGEVLPAAMYDNALLQDSVEIPVTPELGLDRPSRVFRARRNGAPVALVFEAAAPDGYSGRIGLILAMRAGGDLVAVRVTQHKETPGLGDYIDPKKDRNKAHPWIAQFNDMGFDTVPPTQWRVKKEGGRFDQRAGATISARAVTSSISRALRYAVDHREQLFAAATTTPVKP